MDPKGLLAAIDVLGAIKRFRSTGLQGEERKIPSSPATAKITKVGLQLHFGGAHAHPGNRISNL